MAIFNSYVSHYQRVYIQKITILMGCKPSRPSPHGSCFQGSRVFPTHQLFIRCAGETPNTWDESAIVSRQWDGVKFREDLPFFRFFLVKNTTSLSQNRLKKDVFWGGNHRKTPWLIFGMDHGDHGFPAPFWQKLGDKLPGGFLFGDPQRYGFCCVVTCRCRKSPVVLSGA